jgi:hypothetical protein
MRFIQPMSSLKIRKQKGDEKIWQKMEIWERHY